MELAHFIPTRRIEKVWYTNSDKESWEGALVVTEHHLIISSDQKQVWLLHSSIDCVEKKLNDNKASILLKCKNFNKIQVDIPNANDCINLAYSVEHLSNINDVSLCYPFHYQVNFDIMEDGWQAFSPELEYSRLISCSDDWRLSDINKDYSICGTYPQKLPVPKSISDDIIRKSSAFRQGGRFPLLCYIHKKNSTVLLQSSQPFVSQSNHRCKDDEKLINSVLGPHRRGYILDTRSPPVIKAAAQKGGGIEPEGNYSQWRHRTLNIERPIAFHGSLIKLIEACDDVNVKTSVWLSKLKASNWLGYVKDILTGACIVTKYMDIEGACLLVHSTNGTDTSLQVVSLSQLLLDPDCRTIRGFEALIERDWLFVGHPFARRCARSAFATSGKGTEAPSFLLFLDCVWQIWLQYPCSFEFNEEFLILLFEHSYSSQFGTFLCNSDKERKQNSLHSKTVSLWSFINQPRHLSQYMNPLYEPNPSVLWPSVASPSLVLWESLYQKHLHHVSVQQELWKGLVEMKEQDQELKAKAIKLRNPLLQLVSEYNVKSP